MIVFNSRDVKAQQLLTFVFNFLHKQKVECQKSRGGGVMPYMGHIGMCRCKGYGFQAVYSSIGYINQRSRIGYLFHETDQLVEDFI